MTDGELVDRARCGETTAFGELVERHRSAVFRAALAALGSREDADEVAQDAFIVAFQKLESFRGEASFKTWVLTIAWRQALDRRKSVVKRFKRFVSGDVEQWPEPPATARSQEQALVDRDLGRQVRMLMKRLPPKLRDPLLLWASGDYTYDEMADALKVPSGTVKWRVNEARRQLKDKLARLGYCHDPRAHDRPAQA